MSPDLVDRTRLRASLERIASEAANDRASHVARPWVSARLERDTIAVSNFTQFRVEHEFRADESVERGGHDSAPSPLRYLLSSIAFCVLGWCAKTWAAADVPVHRLEADVRTRLDLRGEHRVGEVPPHPTWFVLELRVDDETDADHATSLAREAVDRCPVSALIARAVPVHLIVVHHGATVLDERPDELRSEHREEQTR
ncbi:OsmC family protein [Agromyces subbeticus]|uniref:OsmC family protein n=1 Tax=Agromyces subbeticus TaxID=293890 RepID=UPI0003B5EC9C|nr:OsmC family protein [Agromyces subbeticus]